MWRGFGRFVGPADEEEAPEDAGNGKPALLAPPLKEVPTAKAAE